MTIGIVFPVLPSEMVTADRMGIPNVCFRQDIRPQQIRSGSGYINTRYRTEGLLSLYGFCLLGSPGGIATSFVK